MNTTREAAYPINPVFLDRWSPRAYDGQTMPEEDLLTLLEAARWAPSAFNIQPWRFLYARRGDENWDRFVGLLDEFNAGWAQHASALVFVLSNSIVTGEGDRPDRPSRMHSFDAGAAWAQLALQATLSGYQAHAMAGVYYDKAREVLNVPERYRIEIAVAIGHQTTPDHLTAELREREIPSERLSVTEIAFPGRFPA